MSEVIAGFIRALREADVRVSPSEAIDAGETIALIGYSNRELLRNGLTLTLAKTVDEKEIFADTFDRFFAFDLFTSPDSTSDTDTRPDNEAETPEAAGAFGETLEDVLARGDRAELQLRLAQAARATGLDEIRIFTQRGMYALRILQEMGVDELDAQIAAARAQERTDAAAEGSSGGSAGGDGSQASQAARQRAERLEAARETLRLEVRDYVERRLALFAGNAGRRLREDILSTIRLANVERADMKLIRDLVRRMAKRLVALHSRRRKVALRGQLDIRRTIRANVAYDGLLFETVWKKRRIDCPKVMALCDVSGSVATVSTFLLMFLHSLHEILPDVRSFAFSSRLGEVTDLFEHETIEAAIAQTMKLYGGSSDYGQALEMFDGLAMNDIDHRTTILVLGDARNNNAPPRADILRKAQDRARRVIFLNPEPKGRWNTGDSVMRAYAACAERAMACASLRDLEAVVTDIVRSAV